MKIGIGLPNHIAGTPASAITAWARAAHGRGFESVTTIDRLVYPSSDSIVALALAAGVSSELNLVTNILLAPLYPPALLAKQLGTLAGASGERLTIGIAVGGREDDYDAVGVDFGRRGKILDELTTQLRNVWAGDPFAGTTTPLCPTPVHVPLLFGGTSKATVRRVSTVGDGWVAGALRDYPAQSAFLDTIRTGWKDNGRSGTPTVHASVNFAIGDDAVATRGRAHLADYYGFYPSYADLNVADMLTTADDARATVRAYADMGFDRLLFHPAVASVDQVDRLADAVL